MLETYYQHMVDIGSSLSSKVYDGLRARKYLSWFLNTTKLHEENTVGYSLYKSWDVQANRLSACRKRGGAWKQGPGIHYDKTTYTKEFKIRPRKTKVNCKTMLSWAKTYFVYRTIYLTLVRDALEVITINDWGLC